jgi:hypothetical protein
VDAERGFFDRRDDFDKTRQQARVTFVSGRIGNIDWEMMICPLQ